MNTQRQLGGDAFTLPPKLQQGHSTACHLVRSSQLNWGLRLPTLNIDQTNASAFWEMLFDVLFDGLFDPHDPLPVTNKVKSAICSLVSCHATKLHYIATAQSNAFFSHCNTCD